MPPFTDAKRFHGGVGHRRDGDTTELNWDFATIPPSRRCQHRRGNGLVAVFSSGMPLTAVFHSRGNGPAAVARRNPHRQLVASRRRGLQT